MVKRNKIKMFNFLLINSNCIKYSKCLLRRMSTALKPAPGKFVEVDSHKIHYEIFGRGKHNVCLVPGGLGSGRTDWESQMETMDKDKFTIIAIDPPGFGHSTSPHYMDQPDCYQKDAYFLSQTLKKLGITKTSSVGWCGGCSTSVVLAAQNPGLVDKLVLLAPWADLDKTILKLWNDYRDINTWSPMIRDPVVELHGHQYVQKAWDTTLDCFQRIADDQGEVCKEEYSMVKCPTLVIHGLKDNWVPFEYGERVAKRISNSKLVKVDDGSHYCHMTHVEYFNKLVEDFLIKQ